MAVPIEYFYFSRTSPPPTFGKYLVSGVIEAPDEEAALDALGNALKTAKSRDSVQNFHIIALATASRDNPNGLLAITTAEED
jgi:hypothetical protein